MGKQRGILDYLFLGMPTGYPIFWYEVKRKGGRLSDDQKIFIEHCELRGIPYDVGYSDDWLDHFKTIEWHLKKGEAL
jgi:hypothetical protein